MFEIASSDLEMAKLQHEIILKVKAQLQKDFQLYDELIELKNKDITPYQDLFSQIVPIISRMLNLDSSRFFSLLYTIDISESKVREILFGHTELDAAQEISHLILERELKKVLTKIAYSKIS